jgi:putative toxin-antitoxin system antitoxin component (TIGR02293 family)
MEYLIAALGGPRVVGRQPATAGEWASRIESGLPAASALAFKQTLGLTNAELAALLGVSVRTLARWNPSRSKLDLVSGDRLVRSAGLFAIAAEVLEDADAAARWMKTPQRALAGAVPLHLAQTDVGTRAVEALLGRMEHGVYT